MTLGNHLAFSILIFFSFSEVCFAKPPSKTDLTRPNFIALQFFGLGITKQQLKLGMGLTQNSDLQIEFGRALLETSWDIEKYESYSLHYRRFIYLGLYFKGGFDYYVTHYDHKNYPDSIDKTYGYSANVWSFTVLFGGQFKWKNVVLGGELIGINQPITHEITSEYADTAYPNTQADNESMQAYLNRTWFEGFRAYIGFEF